MLRSLAVALMLLIVLGAPSAHAQLFPSPTPGELPADRTLVDAVLYVNPPTQEGLCIVLGAGQLTVTVRRVTEAVEQKRPARFALYGFMVDPDTHIEIPVSSQEVTTTTHVNGADRYCWAVSIDAPETRNMSMAERGAFVQTIAVRMTFRPD